MRYSHQKCERVRVQKVDLASGKDRMSDRPVERTENILYRVEHT
jgi:hypothetical protein